MSGAARARINSENVPIVRQQFVQAEPDVESTGQPTTPSIPDDLVDDGSSDESTNIHRTYHYWQVILNEEWASIRSTITKQMIWSAALPFLKCTFCETENSNVYCRPCGGYFCTLCTNLLHNGINIFHKPMIWKVWGNLL